MNILCVGLNHLTSPLAIRERLAFDSASVESILQKTKEYQLTGMVILSTCNRVEIYATSALLDDAPLKKILADHANLSVNDLQNYFYSYSNNSVVEHLFHVTAGLDSAVFGKSQILGQVSEALEASHNNNQSASLLTQLFQAAIHTGKRVHSETSIASTPTSIAGVAVRLAAENFADISSLQVTVLGAGKTATLLVDALHRRGVQNLTIMNRTLSHAQDIANYYGGSARQLSDLPTVLQTSDLVLTSTSAPQPTIQVGTVASIMQHRPSHPLTLIDVAVPRDIESSVANIPNVFLHNMDSLQAYVINSLNSRKQEQPFVEKILAEELEHFNQFLQEQHVLPLISALYHQAELIRKNEFEKRMAKLSHLTEAERTNIEAMTQSIVKKILHTPVSNIRNASHIAQADQLTTLLQDLFNVEPQKQ